MWPFAEQRRKRSISQVMVELSDSISNGPIALTESNLAVLRLIKSYWRFVKIRKLNIWEQRIFAALEDTNADHGELKELLEALAYFGTSEVYTVFDKKTATEHYDVVSKLMHKHGIRSHQSYSITGF